ncbi:hypothetical protein A1395_06215 [Pseudomonas protegens]|nr:hypothetical protein A1395_06215 [Pseudomonas protegens]
MITLPLNLIQTVCHGYVQEQAHALNELRALLAKPDTTAGRNKCGVQMVDCPECGHQWDHFFECRNKPVAQPPGNADTAICRDCFTEQPKGVPCNTCAEVVAKRSIQHQGEPVAWRVQRITPTGNHRLDRPLLTLATPEEWGPAWKAEPLYTHPAEQPVLASDQWPKLEKPALVGAGRFSIGLSARLVVEAAQRHYEYETTPENETLRIATGENFLALLAQLEQLRGLRPAVPPRPPEGNGLPRYGLRWNGPQQPLATPMDDGYWTPWHLAAHQQTQSFQAQFSALREAMENAAARRNPCQLIVGDIHIAVTYHGIKWFHTRISGDNQQHPLTIEEFDEIAASALGGKQ